MAEDARSSQPGTSRRRAVDWSAVGGYAFEWLIAVGEYVFTALIAGLAGGYFGQLLDGGLYFIHEEWVGRGRQWGWVTAAVVAAIGLPLGWVRRDGKKFSIPSPRSLRKRAAEGARKRRRKRRKHEFRSLADVAKGGGVAGLIGAVLGFFLGGALAMCWFSLAMSPFAATEWFESLEFGKRAEDSFDRDERSRRGISTSHPLPISLWFGSVLVLGGLGTVVGTGYGAAQYGRYLVTVPAAVRKRHREKKRQPVIEKAQAAAAAIEQGLPVLASPPRPVPLRAQWQLLRGGVGLGFVVGMLFFVAGLIFAPLLVLGWRHDPAEVPLVAVTFAAIFLSIGGLLTVICFRNWRREVAVLRCGFLARCRIAKCKHPQKGKWMPYDSLLEELRAAWETPLAAYNTEADTKDFQRFGTFAGCFAGLVFLIMAAAMVFVTGGAIYVAVVENEPVAWFGLAFAAVWWTVMVWMARTFFRQAGVLRNVGRQSLKTIGIRPIVECRIRFSPPGCEEVEFETKIDLSRRLAADRAGADGVVVYDPREPAHALLLSSFTSPLEVGGSHQWQSAKP